MTQTKIQLTTDASSVLLVFAFYCYAVDPRGSFYGVNPPSVFAPETEVLAKETAAFSETLNRAFDTTVTSAFSRLESSTAVSEATSTYVVSEIRTALDEETRTCVFAVRRIFSARATQIGHAHLTNSGGPERLELVRTDLCSWTSLGFCCDSSAHALRHSPQVSQHL